MRSRERLFRVIVVLGAGNTALAACAGRSTSNDTPGDHSASSAGTPSAGATGGHEPIDTGAGGTLTIDVAGSGPAAMGGATTTSVGGVGGQAGPAFGGDASSAAGGEAGDGPCEHSQQYTCYSTDDANVDCKCNLDAPLFKDDCEDASRFICMSYEPPTGCECVWVTGPR